jgi:hypothetical protein
MFYCIKLNFQVILAEFNLEILFRNDNIIFTFKYFLQVNYFRF